jgi:hypothetical protein
MNFHEENKLAFRPDPINGNYPLLNLILLSIRESLNHYALSYDGGDIAGYTNVKFWLNGEYQGEKKAGDIGVVGWTSSLFTLSNIGSGINAEVDVMDLPD